MKNLLSRTALDETSERLRAGNALRTAVVILIVLVVFDVFSTSNYLNNRIPTQMYAMLLSYAATLSTLFCMWLIRRSMVNIGVWGLILINLTALLLSPLLGSGLGVIYAVTAVMITAVIAGQGLEARYLLRAYAIGVISAIAIILLDFSLPASSATTSNTGFTYIILSGLLLALVFVIIRQAWTGSLRTKLLVSVITLTVISIGTLAATNYYYSRTNLTNNAGIGLKSLANSQAASISSVLIQEAHLIQSFDLSKLVQDRVDEVNAFYGSDLLFKAANLERIQVLDQQWRAANAGNNDNDPLVRKTLNSVVSSELREFRETFPENTEVFVTDKYGALIAATNRTSDYYQADEDWWQAAYNNGKGAVYFGQPEFDESSKTFGIILAVPIVGHGTNEVTGVMRTTINIDAILAILNVGVLGGTGHTDLYLPGGQVISSKHQQGLEAADPQALAHLSALVGNTAYDTFTYDGTPSVVSAAQVSSTDPQVQSAIKNLGWTLIVNQSQADSLAPISQQTQSTLLIALAILAVSAIVAAFVAQTLTSPIARLTAVAVKLGEGDLTVQADTTSKDEIGTLARAFNGTTSQMRNFINSLEERVAERTANLEAEQQQSEKRAEELQAISEISQIITSEQKLETLLPLITRLVSERFDFYHTGIFLIEETKQFAVLQAANSEGGGRMLIRGHRLELGHGIVGYVAKTGIHRIALDVGLDSTYFNNPDLPTTRSEMALPLKIRNQVIGALDVQSEKPNAFTESDAKNLSILTDQISIALENARLFESTQQTLDEMQALYRQNLQENWAAFSLDENLVGYHQTMKGGTKLREPIESDEIRQSINRGTTLFFNGNENAQETTVIVPIKLRGQVIGTLKIKAPTTDRQWTSDEVNLMEAISERLSIALENARLIQESQRQVIKQQTIRDMTEKISTSINLKNVLQIAVEELGRMIPGSEVVLKLTSKDSQSKQA